MPLVSCRLTSTSGSSIVHLDKDGKLPHFQAKQTVHVDQLIFDKTRLSVGTKQVIWKTPLETNKGTVRNTKLVVFFVFNKVATKVFIIVACIAAISMKKMTSPYRLRI